MLRRSFPRLGHQMFQEPLPNVEHNTLARGKMTHNLMMQRMQQRVALFGSGLVAFLYSVYWCPSFHSLTVSAKGVIS